MTVGIFDEGVRNAYVNITHISLNAIQLHKSSHVSGLRWVVVEYNNVECVRVDVKYMRNVVGQLSPWTPLPSDFIPLFRSSTMIKE
jgi:hypothetical protein